MTRDWTVIKITIPGRYKRTIQDAQSGGKRAPTAEEAAEQGLVKMPDRHGFQIVGLAELPALKARLERHGRKVVDAYPENAPAPKGGA